MATVTITFKSRVPKWKRDRTLAALIQKQLAKKNRALALLITTGSNNKDN